MVWILLLAAAIVALVLIVISVFKKQQQETVSDHDRPDFDAEGAPIFTKKGGEPAKPVDRLGIGEIVYVPSPWGVLVMSVKSLSEGTATLVSLSHEARVKYDPSYASSTVANKYGIPVGCYRVQWVRQTVQHQARRVNWKQEVRDWVESDSIFGLTGDDFLDLMIMYYFFFDGYDYPYEYYDALDPADPGMSPEYWDDAAGEFVYPPEEEVVPVERPQLDNPYDEPPAEEPPAEEPQVAVESNEQLSDDLDNQTIGSEPEPPPAPEPAYEPAPDPEPETKNWGGGYDAGSSDSGGGWGSSDSGGSYDSGGDSGGSWD